jgi:hypothetical protein
MSKERKSETPPHDVVGIWRRDSLEYADGTHDRSLQVFWGQTSQWFVDIRIPCARPTITRQGFAELSKGEASALALQRGFAGCLERRADRFTWVRHIDFQPPTGRPDEAIVQIDGDKLLETGTPDAVLGVPYTERYTRICSAKDRRIALTLDLHHSRPRVSGVFQEAILLLLDDYFMIARDRRIPLAVQPAGGLSALVAGSQLGSDSAQFLDCELAMGRLRGGDTPWHVDLSTLPWQEGASLVPPGETLYRDGRIHQMSADGELVWNIAESTLPGDDLADLMSRP